MKNIVFTFFLFIICFVHSNAQNGTPYSLGARSMAMGQTHIANQDAYSVFANPSAMIGMPDISLAVFGEQRFIGTNINHLLAGAIIPTKSGHFSAQIQYFGIKDFNEQKVALAYGKKLFKRLSLGLEVNMLNTRIKEYGSRSNFGFGISFLAPVSKTLIFGGRIQNPIRSEITEGDNLASLYTFGCSYQPSAKVTVNAEVEKTIEQDLSIRGGVEYWMHPRFALRVGASTSPTLVTMGFGIKINEYFNIDIGSTYHQVLGVSPGLSVNYQIKKK